MPPQFLTHHSDIKSWLHQHRITDYQINPDLSVDVDSDVFLSGLGLLFFPLQFNVVKGCFDCERNRLTSLLGAPRAVHSYFDCSYNLLDSLQHAPDVVGLEFVCRDNDLADLLFFPQNIEGNCYLENNPHLGEAQYVHDPEELFQLHLTVLIQQEKILIQNKVPNPALSNDHQTHKI